MFKYKWEYFLILSSSSSSLILFLLYDFQSLCSSQLFITFSFSLCPHSGFLALSLWALCLFLSLGFYPILLVCGNPHISFLFNSGVYLSICFSLCRLLLFNLFLWVSVPLIHWVSTHPTLFEYLILSTFLCGFPSVLSLPHSLSWYVFSLSLYYSFLGIF